MSAGPSDLFTGEDDATGSTGSGPGPDLPLDPTDSISLRGFLADLTYREVHALTAGFVPWFLGLLMLPIMATAGTVLVGIGVGVIGAAYGAMTLDNRALRYVVKEPHYAGGGAALGATAGLFGVGVMTAAGAFLGHPFGLTAASTATALGLVYVALTGAKRAHDRLTGWWP